MATLPQVLAAQTSVPAQVEAKFTFLPKLSKLMQKVASSLPAGPNFLPSMTMKSPKLPNIPNPFKGVTSSSIIPNPRTVIPTPGGSQMVLAGSDSKFIFK
jgi:hypothetical protein